jgi:hypothetical protein
VSDDFARVRERIRQARENLTEAGAPPGDGGALDWQRRGGTFVAGDRVFDTLTGQEGLVRAVTTENLVTRAPAPPAASKAPTGFALPTSRTVTTVQVDLGGGHIVPRRPDELVLRPQRPTAPAGGQ